MKTFHKVRKHAYGRPLNLSKCAYNGTDAISLATALATVLYHCNALHRTLASLGYATQPLPCALETKIINVTSILTGFSKQEVNV